MVTMNPPSEPNQSGSQFVQAAKTGESAAVEVAKGGKNSEIESSLVIAKRFPRDQTASFKRIITSCERASLANQAIYKYPKGGTSVEGPSIRLAEAIAQQWGNIRFGTIQRERKASETVMVAYAWDLETNTYVEQEFTVKHWRDTKKGGYELTDEREIYEATANQGSRRLRACILRVIPGDVIDAAVDQCEKTMISEVGPIEDAIREMIIAFDKFGVSQKMIEARLGHNIEATTHNQIADLRKIFRSIKDEMSDREEWFDLNPGKKVSDPAPKTEAPEPAETPEEESDIEW